VGGVGADGPAGVPQVAIHMQFKFGHAMHGILGTCRIDRALMEQARRPLRPFWRPF
jgi:hypothetical protein